jgi:hypothetical protein
MAHQDAIMHGERDFTAWVVLRPATPNHAPGAASLVLLPLENHVRFARKLDRHALGAGFKQRGIDVTDMGEGRVAPRRRRRGTLAEKLWMRLPEGDAGKQKKADNTKADDKSSPQCTRSLHNFILGCRMVSDGQSIA